MYQLRPYQQDAVNATLSHFRREKTPAVIVLPTGAGKSLVIADLARIAKGRVLVLAHVRELVEQNHAKYLSLRPRRRNFFCGIEPQRCESKNHLRKYPIHRTSARRFFRELFTLSSSTNATA